jgi:hypothetical protein
MDFDSYSNVINRLSKVVNKGASLGGTDCNLESQYTIKSSTLDYITNLEVDNLIGDNALLLKIVDLNASECYKYAPDLTGIDEELEKKIKAEYEEKYHYHFAEAQYLANRYGGAFIYLNAEQGTELNEPLNPELPMALGEPVVLTQEEVRVADFDKSLYNPPNYYQISGNREYNLASVTFNFTLQPIHKSRFLCFYGRRIRGEEFRSYNFRHKPLWLSALTALYNYETALSASLNMLKNYDIFIYKMQGLAKEVAKACVGGEAGEAAEDTIFRRLSMLTDAVTLTKAMHLDKDLEDAEFINRNYDGVNAIVEDLRRAFAERVDIPASILFASSSGNLFGTDTGLSDRYIMAANINKKQRTDIIEEHRKIFRYLGAGQDTKGLNIRYRSTIELTHKEQSALAFDYAKADASNVVAQIMTPQMCARRYSDAQITPHIQLSPQDIKAISNKFTAINQPSGANSAGVNTQIGGTNALSLGSH